MSATSVAMKLADKADMPRRVAGAPLFLALAATWLTATAGAAETAVLRLDPQTTYQTWEAWSCAPSPSGAPFGEWLANPTAENYDRLGVNTKLPAKLIARMQDELVYDLGFTRVRLEVGPQVEMENDNADPNVTDPRGYRFLWQDNTVETQVLPIKKRIESTGGKMVIYISYDIRSSLTKPFLLRPEEYAEMAETFLRHLKEKYGLEPDYWSVLNEPGNHRPGDPKLCAEITAAVGRRIARAGFKTKMSGPECVTVAQIPAYMEAMQKTPGALDQFRQITYHLYWGGCNDIPGRRAVREWARKLGVTAAQTEWMEQADMDVARHIYLCLAEADAVAWDRYGADLLFTLPYDDLLKPDSDGIKPEKNSTAWHIRQFSRFIRPGAVRVRIDSNFDSVKAVAFLSPKKKPVLVLLNLANQPQAAQLVGLPGGSYDVSYTSAPDRAFGKPLPAIGIGQGESLTMTLPPQSVCTITADPPTATAASD